MSIVVTDRMIELVARAMHEAHPYTTEDLPSERWSDIDAFDYDRVPQPVRDEQMARARAAISCLQPWLSSVEPQRRDNPHGLRVIEN